ncbi:MAG: sensor histidine kinase, partial [Verrucomicrobia bacterium]
VHRLLWTQIAIDLLVLTAVIHWLGSRSPWTPHTYLFHIVLACIVFHARESLWVVALAAGAYLGCLAWESVGVLPATSIFPGAVNAVSGEAAGLAYHLAGLALIWLVIWWLVSQVAAKLRDREIELAATNLRLEASCDERTAHMLQTTHQLKAPFAAIHAQVQLLLSGYCGALPPKAIEILGKISTRCLALSRQIQEMLQLANLRSQGQQKPAVRTVDVAAVLDAAIKRLEPTARQRGIRIEAHLEPAHVQTPEDHLTMMLENILVNAVTYSFDGGKVEVSCRPREESEVEIVVRDEGLGIQADKLPHIFEDYYRTDEALRHNRSSTGLGLAVVRQVARSLRARVRVESAPGWGTRFTIRLPRARPDDRTGRPAAPLSET